MGEWVTGLMGRERPGRWPCRARSLCRGRRRGEFGQMLVSCAEKQEAENLRAGKRQHVLFNFQLLRMRKWRTLGRCERGKRL